VAIFMMATVAAGIVTGPVSGWILQNMNGVNGWHGWQWMFLVEGLPSVALGFVVFFMLADSPAQAKWLTAAERQVVQQSLAAEQAPATGHGLGLKQVFRDPKVYLLCFMSFTVLAGVYFMSFWVPTMIAETGISDLTTVGLYSVIPNLIGAVAMILYGRHSDRRQERRWHFALAVLVGAAGMLALSVYAKSLPLLLLTLTIGGSAMMSALPIFWAHTTRYLSAEAAPAGIALITSLGSIAGITPALVGQIKTQTGSLTLAIWLFSGLLVLGAITMLIAFPKQRAA
jgi:MFS family permease